MVKEKLTRREMKDDRLVDFAAEAMELFKKHRVRILNGAFALFLVVVVLSVYLYTQRRANSEYNVLFHKAEALYRDSIKSQDTERLAEAALLFRKAHDEYPRTEGAHKALFYQGEVLFHLHKFDRAINIYRDYLKRYPKKSFAPLAQEAIGYCFEEGGDYQGAIEEYKKVRDRYPDNYIVERVYLAVERCYKARGEVKKR